MTFGEKRGQGAESGDVLRLAAAVVQARALQRELAEQGAEAADTVSLEASLIA